MKFCACRLWKGGSAVRLVFQKGDLLAIALVLLLAAAVLLVFLPGGGSGGTAAEIYRDGVLIRVVDLTADQEFTLEGAFHTTVTVSGGRIAVTASGCPGGDCVRTGWISAPGRSIVCLPGRLEIRILGQSAVDFVVG